MLVIGISLLVGLSAGRCAAKEALVVSYVQTPEVAQNVLPFMKKVYESAGITASFSPVAIERGLFALQEGVVDADVMRIKEAADEFDNIITVGPPLTGINIVLYCRIEFPCDSTVFNQRVHPIAVPNVRFFWEQVLNKEQFDIQIINSWAQVKGLFQKNRINYFVWMELTRFNNNESSPLTTNSTIIYKSEMYHVINKKHQALADDVARAIAGSELLQTK